MDKIVFETATQDNVEIPTLRCMESLDHRFECPPFITDVYYTDSTGDTYIKVFPVIQTFIVIHSAELRRSHFVQHTFYKILRPTRYDVSKHHEFIPAIKS